MIKVRIPATSANIGPGFDSLGVAVNLYNYIYMQEAEEIRIRCRDNLDIPLKEDNLVYKTVKHVYDLCGKPLYGLEVEQINNIPLARGLGSSSACIIGGILGANEMLGCPFTQDEIIDMAATMEGHPDNSTPALIGGLVTAVLDNEKVWYVKQEVLGELKFAAIIPDFELQTVKARGILPTQIPHVDARFNLSRAALMAVSLYSGKYENLRTAAGDQLHQPYRIGLIPGGQEAMDACYKNGAYAAYISGAGSAIMAIFNDRVLDFEQKTRDDLDEMGLHGWKLYILSIDNNGAMVMKD